MRADPRMTLLAALLAITAFLAVTFAGCDQSLQRDKATEPASSARRVHALGRIEPASGVLSISATPGDRLKWLDPEVVENGQAPANGVLGILASYDLRLAQLRALEIKKTLTEQKLSLNALLAQAQEKVAQASLAEAEAKRAEADLQENRLEHLKESAEIAAEDYRLLVELTASDPELVTPHRLRKMANQVAAAQTDYDIARESYASGVAVADAACQAALANLHAAQTHRSSLGSRKSVEAVERELDAARQVLRQSVLWAPGATLSATEALEACRVKEGSPGALTVLKVFTRPGEVAPPTPLLQLGDLSKLVCVAEVYEADAKNVSEGQGATITSPAFPGALAPGLSGIVRQVAKVVSSPGMRSRNPLAPADRSIIEVQIEVVPSADQSLDEAAKLIGLQVAVQFDEPTNPTIVPPM